MKLRMTLIDARDLTPLEENSYGENILRDDSERGFFMTQIYFRDSRRRIQIPAFELKDAPAKNFSLEFSANEDGSNRRKFTEKNGLYFNPFDGSAETLGWSTAGLTYIFVVKDGEIYGAPHKLKALDEIFDFSFAADENSLPAEKMWQIYEWWVLAKIVEFLVVKLNWRVDYKNDNPAEILRALFDNLENIQRAHIRLTHKNPAMTLELFYNTKIAESLNAAGCNLRPDYLFKITAGGATKFFILDAKYRNYRHQGFNHWLEKDLRGICADKYMTEIKNSAGVKISAACIVHSDRTPDASKFLGRYVVYNGTADERCRDFFSDFDGANQQVGSFYLLPNVEDSAPNQSELNLSLFFKLIFEYFMEQWRNCWECDTPARVELQDTRSGYPKYHMRCEKCGAFWVKNHCGDCEAHPPLVKHALNYHVEESGKWFVICPKCRNEQRGR